MIASAAGLSFVVTEGFFSTAPARRFLRDDPRRYADLAGPEIGLLMAQLDWHYTGMPVCVMGMTIEGEVCAMGWAGPTSRGQSGGVNLSYATAAPAQGRGLAALATSLALLELHRQWPIDPSTQIHAQFRVTNVRSCAVATRLGLCPDATLLARCAVPAAAGAGPLEKEFEGSSAPWSSVGERAREIAGAWETLTWEEHAHACQRHLRERARARA